MGQLAHRVSVLLPNLNHRPFLEERLKSIQAQTFNDWELIIVDNYSDDGAWEFFKGLPERDPRIRIYQAPRQGMYDNWNNCIRLAKGEYIYIATSDDTMAAEFLAVMVKALDEHPDCDLAHCKLKIIDENGNPHLSLNWDKFYCAAYFGDLINQKHIRPAPHDGLLHCAVKTVYTSITQLLIRRSLFERIGLFLTNYGSIADFEWEMRASLVANTLHVPEYLASWRVHRNQGTNLDFLNSAAYRTQLLRFIDLACKSARRADPAFSLKVKKGELQQLYLKELFKLEIIERKQKAHSKFFKYEIALKWLFKHPKILLLFYRYVRSKDPNKVFSPPGESLTFSRKLLAKFGLKAKVLEARPFSDKTIELGADPILIYQMGKVGSSSVLSSLKQAGIAKSIFHVHQLSDKGIERKEKWLKQHKADGDPNRMKELQYIKKLKAAIAAKQTKANWKIIALTRDPVSVELSSFFENIDVYGHEVCDPSGEINIAKAIDFLKRTIFAAYDVNKDYFCVWFDEELKMVFDIDVYAVPYDFARGYTIISKKNVSVLVMRMEDMGRSFGRAMADFLKVPQIELIKDNTADNKSYWREYQSVLEKFSIPGESFDLIYSSLYARHFYPEDEREKSRKKWVSAEDIPHDKLVRQL